MSWHGWLTLAAWLVIVPAAVAQEVRWYREQGGRRD